MKAWGQRHNGSEVPAKGSKEPVTEDSRPLAFPGCVQPMRVTCFLTQLLFVSSPMQDNVCCGDLFVYITHCVGRVVFYT